MDIGCGKGRPVFVAESFGYEKLTGIDLDEELISIANSNLKNYSLKRKTSNIQFVHANALEYKYENEPTVCFLFNPFNEEVLKKVLQRIINSTSSETWFVYMNPKYLEAFTLDKFEIVKELKTKRYLEAIVYRIKR